MKVVIIMKDLFVWNNYLFDIYVDQFKVFIVRGNILTIACQKKVDLYTTGWTLKDSIVKSGPKFLEGKN